MRRMLYKIHRDVGIVIGIFILIETITGILMVWPFAPYNRVKPPVIDKEDIKGVTISPSEAVEILEKTKGKELQVEGIMFKQVLNNMVYKISLKDKGVYLIDAMTGQEFKITEELATQIAVNEYPLDGEVLKTERLEKNKINYLGRALPIYRVVFDDNDSTVSHISISDGSLYRDNLSIRVRWFLSTLHNMEVIKLLTGRSTYRRVILIVLGMIATVITLIGYYQYFYSRKNRKQQFD